MLVYRVLLLLSCLLVILQRGQRFATLLITVGSNWLWGLQGCQLGLNTMADCFPIFKVVFKNLFPLSCSLLPRAVVYILQIFLTNLTFLFSRIQTLLQNNTNCATTHCATSYLFITPGTNFFSPELIWSWEQKQKVKQERTVEGSVQFHYAINWSDFISLLCFLLFTSPVR